MAKDVAKFEQWKKEAYTTNTKIQNWAVFNKMETLNLAQKFMGQFAIGLMAAFQFAEGEDLEKMFSTWPEYFEELYNFKRLLEK